MPRNELKPLRYCGHPDINRDLSTNSTTKAKFEKSVLSWPYAE